MNRNLATTGIPWYAAIASRLVTTLALLWIVLVLVDDVSAKCDATIINLRIGLWIYLVELLLAIYFEDVSDSAPSPALHSMSGAPQPPLIAEAISLSIRTAAVHAISNLIWRVPALVLGTMLMAAWCGQGFILYAAALVPTGIHTLAQRSLKPGTKPTASVRERGSHLGPPEEVQRRAAQLRALVELEADRETGG